MADPRDPNDTPQTTPQDSQAGETLSPGLEQPGVGRDYGYAFGGGGRNQGFDGSWGQGYGGTTDYGQPGDERSWMDACADEECAGRGPHRGRGPQSWAPDDRRIYEAVCERLLHDRLIDARDMEVEVDAGVVYLRGRVAHASDPAHAAMLARETSGVKDVVSELSVSHEVEAEPQTARQDDDGRTDRSPLGYPILPT